MRLIIAGGRDFTDQNFGSDSLFSILKSVNLDTVEVVCGMARGADEVGRVWAINNNIPVKEFRADWDKHGKSAGYKRNNQMAEYGTHLIAFWDGKSKGTKHMIDLARKSELFVKIVNTTTGEIYEL
jgi:hypothetical protein